MIIDDDKADYDNAAADDDDGNYDDDDGGDHDDYDDDKTDTQAAQFSLINGAVHVWLPLPINGI